ncbi:hypothetical protein [Nonomuraea sp. NPDC049784]|uniref:hypothetical protein n=1 Tax=Nonomuraea sp. NPDC049784 TaxID=3154361 RepID=UPI0033FBE5DB
MTEEETRAYWDIPENGQYMCDVLMRVHPDWTLWREEGVWHARYGTWPPHQRISERCAGLLNLTIRLGGALS